MRTALKLIHRISTCVGSGYLSVALMDNFTRSGNVYLYTGSLKYLNRIGYYWSSAAYTDIYTSYRLGYNEGDLLLDVYDAHWDSYGLRCLAV